MRAAYSEQPSHKGRLKKGLFLVALPLRFAPPLEFSGHRNFFFVEILLSILFFVARPSLSLRATKKKELF